MACLRANIFHIEIPSKAPRSEEFRLQVGEMAACFKVAEFVPNDAKAKEIQQSVDKAGKDEEKKEEEEKQEELPESLDEVEKIRTDFISLFKTF